MDRSKHTGRTSPLLTRSGLVAAFLAGTGAGMVAQSAHADGIVRCWGQNNYGQCNTPADLGPCASVAGGGFHTIALRTDGGVRCWGEGLTNTGSFPNYGQCNTPADLGPCSSIAGGRHHTIALTAPPPIDTDNCPAIANPTQADCNSNGVGDLCEVAAGAPDFNHDTIPDTCQCLADLFVDRQVNGADLGYLLSNWGPCTT